MKLGHHLRVSIYKTSSLAYNHVLYIHVHVQKLYKHTIYILGANKVYLLNKACDSEFLSNSIFALSMYNIHSAQYDTAQPR